MGIRRFLAIGATGCQLAALAVVLGPAPQASAGVPPSEWVIGTHSRVVYLTFNGQTQAKHLLQVQDTLDAKGARASFFIPGRWVASHKGKVEDLRKADNFIGNRGYSQDSFTSMSDDQIRSSISRTENELRHLGANPRPYVRMPNGKRDLRVLRAVGSLGYRSVRWTYQAKGGLAENVARKVLKHRQPGAIISLDLWRKSHRNALPKIVTRLRNHHYEFKTIRRLDRAHPVRWDVTLSQGSSGSEVSYLQKELKSISYPTSRSGSFGYSTLQSVYAFAKVNGMARNEVVSPSEMERIAKARAPKAKNRSGRRFIDIDISRQVMFEVRKGKVRHTTPISSGNEEFYTIDGQTYKAHTPRGSFVIERKIAGWRTSRLGRLWYPSYFVGGFAIHGSQSVPTYPASHGCVRMPMYATKPFYDRNPIGTRTYVHD